MDAQDSLAAGVLADLKAQAPGEFPIARAILGTLEEVAIGQLLRNAIISKNPHLKMGTLEVAFSIFPRGTDMAIIAKSAHVPADDFDRNRKTIELINGQQLVGKDGSWTLARRWRRSTVRFSSRGPAKFPSSGTWPSGPCWACTLQSARAPPF